MAQLVGKNCVFCNGRISDELNSRFCPDCKNPRHDKCARPPAEPTDTACPQCGAAVDPAKKVPAPVPLPPLPGGSAGPPPPPGPFPVARVCPKCGSAKCKLVRPQKLVAFKWDRACKECGTHYTPPTPRWAARSFVFVGLLFMLGSLFFLYLSWNRGFVPATLCETPLGLAFMWLGWRGFDHGMSALVEPGKV